MTPSVETALFEYCRSHPARYGVCMSARGVAGSRLAQVRLLLGLARCELVSRLRTRTGLVPARHTSPVLIDASLGDKHAALWLPVARDLALAKIGVALATATSCLPINSPVAEEAGKWSRIRVPDSARGSSCGRRLPPVKAPRAELGGLFGLVLTMLERYTARLIRAWAPVLTGNGVEVVVTTSPIGLWSGSLIACCRELGIATTYLQQGLPGTFYWRFPACDTAVVWSRVGVALLLGNGWPEASIVVARNPSVPPAEEMRTLRERRRAELAIADGRTCVLFLGQKSRDQVVDVPGYRETCQMIGQALAVACETREAVPLLRPHYGEARPETEGILRACGLERLLVSRGAPLLEDLAAADVVVSMHSAALEEAYLVGRPVVQAVADGFPLGVDFSALGAPLARTAGEAATLLGETGWRPGCAVPADLPSVREVILRRLAEREQHRPAPRSASGGVEGRVEGEVNRCGC